MQEENTIAQTVVWAAHRFNLERELAAAADYQARQRDEQHAAQAQRDAR